jgi:hypothetical protein
MWAGALAKAGMFIRSLSLGMPNKYYGNAADFAWPIWFIDHIEQRRLTAF